MSNNIRAENQYSIPEPMIVNTGEQEAIQNTIEKFFRETRDLVERSAQRPRTFSITSGELAYCPTNVSDDRVTTLFYGEAPIAVAMQRRTELNYIRCDFFRLDELVQAAS